MSVLIGQGENRNLIFRIKPKDASILSDTDEILFAMADNNHTIKKTYSKLVSELSEENGVYSLIVNLDSEFTLGLDLGIYFYDLTLINETEKISLIKPKSIEIVRTVGASIVEDDEESE